MSDFLNELRKNAKTEEEYLRQQKTNEANQKIEREKRSIQYKMERKKAFDEFMKNYSHNIKKVCIEAVEENCYVNYNGNRYILCELSLMHYYDDVYYSDRFFIHFWCFKVEHNSIFFSKRVCNYKSTLVKFDESMKIFSSLNLSNESEIIKKYIDGYTDINVLPKRLVDKNYPNDNDRRLRNPYTACAEAKIASQVFFAIKF